MADFEKNKFSLTTVVMICGSLISAISYMNHGFNSINNTLNEKFEMFEKKYLMAISEQALINQAVDFRMKMFEKRTSENDKKNYYYDPKQAILPSGVQLEDDKPEA